MNVFTSQCPANSIASFKLMLGLAARITKAQGESDAAEKCVALNEFMLRVIDGFLSGGDYLPHRKIQRHYEG